MALNQVDLGGNDVIVKSLLIGATGPGQQPTTTALTSTGAQTVTGVKTFSDSVAIKQSVGSADDTTPTASEITAALGSPARGLIGTIDAGDADTDMFFCVASDASWYFVKLTKSS
jgi:hypothetical protein